MAVGGVDPATAGPSCDALASTTWSPVMLSLESAHTDLNEQGTQT